MAGQHEDRVLFLKEFTKQLIINSKSSYNNRLSKIDEQIDKFFSELGGEEKIEEIRVEVHLPETSPQNIIPRYSPPQNNPPVNRMNILKPIISRQRIIPVQSHVVPKNSGFNPSIMNAPINKQEEENKARNIDFGRLDVLIKDARVTMIECSGPGKFVVAKVLGKPSVTNLSLTQEEITKLIKEFSREARIPIIEGTFKAYVGNLMINAVISELTGTRMIITKIDTRFILEQGK
ncbi:hypothetical protein HYW76_02920 [Candidatus Pacearchaeota archaeon]|nr:hypothetical protein [Candidatus Pacearchaeota archaeon]